VQLGKRPNDHTHTRTHTQCAALNPRTNLSSFGSTKGRQFAKTIIEKKETVWATLRYACEDGETAVSTPMRISLRANSKSSNLNADDRSALPTQLHSE